MKKIISLPLLIMAAIALYSCSASSSELLPGKWKAVSLEFSRGNPETGELEPYDMIKLSDCDKPNAMTYVFDNKNKVTENDVKSCKEMKTEGTYKWLNEEKTLELTQDNSITTFQIITLNKDSLIMTSGGEKAPLVVRMMRVE